MRIGSSKTKWAASSASDSVQTKTQDQIRVPRRLNRVLCLLLALAVSLALVIIQQTNALIQHRTPVDLLLDPLENAQKFRQIAISPTANASRGLKKPMRLLVESLYVHWQRRKPRASA